MAFFVFGGRCRAIINLGGRSYASNKGHRFTTRVSGLIPHSCIDKQVETGEQRICRKPEQLIGRDLRAHASVQDRLK